MDIGDGDYYRPYGSKEEAIKARDKAWLGVYDSYLHMEHVVPVWKAKFAYKMGLEEDALV